MCEPGASADLRRRHAAAHAVDEHFDAGGTRLHGERAHRRRRGGGADEARGVHAAADDRRQRPRRRQSTARVIAGSHRPRQARASALRGSSSMLRSTAGGSLLSRIFASESSRARNDSSPVGAAGSFEPARCGRRASQARRSSTAISSASVGTGCAGSGVSTRGAPVDGDVTSACGAGTRGRRQRDWRGGQRRPAPLTAGGVKLRAAAGEDGGTIDSVGIVAGAGGTGQRGGVLREERFERHRRRGVRRVAGQRLLERGERFGSGRERAAHVELQRAAQPVAEAVRQRPLFAHRRALARLHQQLRNRRAGTLRRRSAARG